MIINRLQQLNRFLAEAEPSATDKMMGKVSAARLRGAPIVSLGTGEPDVDTPDHIRAAATQAIQDGNTRSTQVAGMRGLREAIAEKFKRENGLDVDWSDTIVCSGARQAIFNALAATLNEGDEVVIPAPYWVGYPETVALCGATPVVVACEAPEGFKITPHQLSDALTDKTRWVILNSPSNPTGAVYTREELLALGGVLLKYPDVLILSDDSYEHLVFDDVEFCTMAQVEPRLRARTLTVNGVSKAYAMTGWRIGFATGPSWLIDAMEKLQGQQTSGACSISQFAAMAALDGPKDFIFESRALFQQRRDRVVNLLNGAPGITCGLPSGAFYVFASCKGLIGKSSPSGKLLSSDEEIAYALLDEAGVAVVHGAVFGLEGYLRIAYTLDDTSLDACCDAIIAFCNAC